MILGALVKLRKATISFVMCVRPSVRMEQLGFHWTDFSWNLILDFFSRKSVEKLQNSLKSDKKNLVLYMKTNTHFFIISHSIILKIRNVSDASFRGNQTTHSVFSKVSRKSCRFEITWKNTGERMTSQMTVWRIRIACWIPKITNIHSEYIILIAFSTTTMVARMRLKYTLNVVFCLVVNATDCIAVVTDC